jgi:carbonic anhydrase/acetyltransferase-like protein (isoleucine patch superfamily)
MIHSIGHKVPDTKKSLFIAWNAEIAGDVKLEAETSIWFSAVLRGDIAAIRLGRGSNVQDGAVLHVDFQVPTVVGEYVTIGHGAIIHGCTIGDRCIIGMGAIILSGAQIPSGCIVGAGALVTASRTYSEGSLIIGSPARVIRKLAAEEVEKIIQNAESYIKEGRVAQESYSERF